jgi:epoxyqueuosine reductase
VQAEGVFPVEHREALGDRIYGCDDCQLVCPVNLRHSRPTAGAGAVPSERWVDLVELLDATDDELLARHGRWYIARRDPRYLRRNALVALGNVGDSEDPAVVGAVRRHLDHADPLVRAHAVWAARRLGLDALVAEAMAAETDAVVRVELDRVVPGSVAS